MCKLRISSKYKILKYLIIEYKTGVLARLELIELEGQCGSDIVLT